MPDNRGRAKRYPLSHTNIFSLALFIPLLSLSGLVSAHVPRYYKPLEGDSPVIPPQIPLGDDPPIGETHKFVSWLSLAPVFLFTNRVVEPSSYIPPRHIRTPRPP